MPPPSTPAIELTVTLTDFSGVAIGSAASPAYVRIALCGFGQQLPRVPGTNMIGKVATNPFDIAYTGTSLTIPLYGNDVITPSGTYYAISILDTNKNVIQAGQYYITGTATIDLSELTPSLPIPPGNPVISFNLITIAFSVAPVFNCALLFSNIAFDLTLAGNVTSSTLLSPFPGQLVTFFISQNNFGNWGFTWPSDVLNAGIINTVANSVSTQSFVARANGDLYPIGPMTYS